jgi:hypothetical protein
MDKLTRVWNAFRYWLFKDSETVDKQTVEIGQKLKTLKDAAVEFDKAVNKVSQEDALRSLVISMNKGGRQI